jgi:hypothetical protein
MFKLVANFSEFPNVDVVEVYYPSGGFFAPFEVFIALKAGFSLVPFGVDKPLNFGHDGADLVVGERSKLSLGRESTEWLCDGLALAHHVQQFGILIPDLLPIVIRDDLVQLLQPFRQPYLSVTIRLLEK